MRSMLLASAALAAGLALGGAPAEARTVTTQMVRGRLLPTDSSSDAHGGFRMLVQDRGQAHRELFDVEAWGLDTTRDGQGNLPSYHAFVVNSDASAEGDFGQVFLGPRGHAVLRFRSARDSFPAGVTTLKDFEGGKVELRLDTAVVLSGDIPSFVGVGDGNQSGSGAATRAFGVERLHHTASGGRARGLVEAFYANRPRAQVEWLRVECIRLGNAGDVFTVVAIDGSSNETTLGTITARTRLGLGVLTLSSLRGDTIPGGGVLALGGQTVEVRDSGGTAWLTGTFPDLNN